MASEHVEIGQGTREVLPGLHLKVEAKEADGRQVVFKAHIDGRPKTYANAVAVRRGQNFILDFFSIDTGSDYLDPVTHAQLKPRPATNFDVDGVLLPTVGSFILEPETALHLLQQLQAHFNASGGPGA